ncbi:MAG: MFS transporter [Nocardioides sp.]
MSGAPPRQPGVLLRTLGSVGDVLRNRDLRRVQLALLASLVGDGAYLTAVTVWAYGQGGAQAVGLFMAAFMSASAILAPIGAALADRHSRRATLLVCDGARVVLVAAAAVCLGLSSPWPVYVLAVAAGALNAPFRSAQRAWMPSLARTPEELTAANASSSTFESLSVFIGPALGGLLLVVADVGTVFWLNVGTFTISMLLVMGVRQQRAGAQVASEGAESVRAQLAAGFRLLGADTDLRNLTFQVAAQTFVSGAARVFLVVIAVEIMESGARGVGLLDAVIGVGAIAGGILALLRVEKQRLGRDLSTGVVLWSLPVGLLALLPYPAFVVLALVVLGVANPLVDVNLDTIVQRMTPDQLMARVFGALDTCYIATKALGALATPLLLSVVGLRWTLVVVSLPVLAIAMGSWRRMVRLDAHLLPPAGLELLRGIAWFALLTPAVLESLARALREVRISEGSRVITEGQAGDDFYLIESGTVAVTHRGRLLRHQGPGDYFGEIALLEQIPRTATVTATSELVLRALDRETFLRALSRQSLRQLGDVATSRRRHKGQDTTP